MFVLWDRECQQLLDISTDQIQANLIQVGVTNPLECPLALDALVAKKLTFKVKWQPSWANASVVLIYQDDNVVKQLSLSIALELTPSSTPVTDDVLQSNKSFDEAIASEEWDLVAEVDFTSNQTRLRQI